MKKINQIFATLMALLILFGMAGCGETVAGPTGSTDSMQASGTADNPGNTDGPDNTKDPDHADEPGKTEELGNTGELEGTILVKSDQNWVPAFIKGTGVFSDQGFYYVDKKILTFLDTESGVSTPLCSRAGCLHGDAPGHGYEECDGYGNVKYEGDMVTFWDGYLYYMRLEAGGTHRLYRCNAIGTEHAEVCQLGKRYTDDGKSLMPAITQGVVDGKWYYHTRVSGLVRDPETGSGRFMQVLEYIAVVDLATGKETILLEDRDNYMMLKAVSPYGVLYTAEEEINESNPMASRKIALKCWNAETGKIGTLFEKTGETVSWIVNNKVNCWSNTRDHGYSFDITTGETQQLEGITSLAYWGRDYARCIDSNGEYFICNLKTGEKLPSQLYLQDLRLESSGDQGCVLMWNILADGSSGENRNYQEGRYCYAAYKDLADGLQESDLLCYRTVKYG